MEKETRTNNTRSFASSISHNVDEKDRSIRLRVGDAVDLTSRNERSAVSQCNVLFRFETEDRVIYFRNTDFKTVFGSFSLSDRFLDKGSYNLVSKSGHFEGYLPRVLFRKSTRALRGTTDASLRTMLKLASFDAGAKVYRIWSNRNGEMVASIEGLESVKDTHKMSHISHLVALYSPR